MSLLRQMIFGDNREETNVSTSLSSARQDSQTEVPAQNTDVYVSLTASQPPSALLQAATGEAHVPRRHHQQPPQQNRAPKRRYKRPGRPPKETTRQILATSDDMRERSRKRKRQEEWTAIRHNWKARKYDLRNEPDVGNAVQRSVEEQMKDRSIQPMDDGMEKDVESVDTSVDEHEQILQRLSASQEPVRLKALTDTRNNEPPYSTSLNFWELGRTAPRSKDLPVQYGEASLGTMTVAREAERRDDNALTVPTFLRPYSYSKAEHSYIPASSLLYPVVSMPFRHHRQLGALAARHVMFVPGQQQSQRLLLALWNPALAQTSRSALVLALSDHYGRNLECFLSHRWPNPVKVAAELGVDGRESAAFVGYSLEPKLLLFSQNMHRKKVQSQGEKCPDWNATSVLYQPVPGAIPPTPTGPLQAGGVLLGPLDRYHYVSHKAAVSESTLQITLSSLLQKLAADTVPESIHQQLIATAMQFLDWNKSKLYKRLQIQQKDPMSELPLSSLAKAALTSCSLAVNVLPSLISSSTSSCSSRTEGDPSTMVADFGNVYEFCDYLKDQNGLQLFSNLHISLGLLEIAQALPREAADKLGSSMDDVCRTPFDRLQFVLEDLEASDSFVEAFVPHSDKVSVVELEYAIHRATQCFAHARDRDPSDVSYHCWYMAGLAASLLLCSGNRIGSGAHRYPSFSGEQSALSQISNIIAPAHEIRKSLPKFVELRRELAESLKSLLVLASGQNLARTQLAVVSFLEWKQVMALLVGDVSLESTVFAQIRLLHRLHAREWLSKENSVESRAYVISQSTSADQTLDAMAGALEADPSALKHWRQLSLSLGSFGSITSVEASKCMEGMCSECGHLLPPLLLDHDGRNKQVDGGSWWGRNRMSWWEYSLLRVPQSAHDVPSAIAERLERMLPSVFEATNLPKDDIPAQSDTMVSTLDMSWIDFLLQHSDGGLDKVPSYEARDMSLDEKLPRPFVELVRKSSMESRDDDVVKSFELTCFLLEDMEIIFHKLVLLGHLYGPANTSLKQGVRNLALSCWNAETKRFDETIPSLTVLQNLSRLGLNISSIVRELG